MAPGDSAVMPDAMETMTRKRVMRKPMRSLPLFASRSKEAKLAVVKSVTGTRFVIT